MKAVEVVVPATSANLGPGFDCLGVALRIHLKVRFSPADRSAITGKGRVRSVEDSLIFRSFKAAFEAAGAQTPAVEVEVAETYASGRGLGASASAIVAGLLGAKESADLPLSSDQLAKLAIGIEGHPDNVLPALLGGMVLTLGDGWIRYEPSKTLAPLVLVARDSFKTKAARKVLPETFAKQDAVANASALAALVSALSGQSDPSTLMAATRDRLHEPYRLPLMPDSLELHKSLRGRGWPTVLSGAGPSLLCLSASDRVEELAEEVDSMLPPGWVALRPGWDLEGARSV